MDWKEFFRPTIWKVVLTTIFVVSGYLFLSSECAITGGGSGSNSFVIYCVTTALIGLPLLFTVGIVATYFGHSLIPVAYIIGILLSYFVAIILILIFEKLRSFVKNVETKTNNPRRE